MVKQACTVSSRFFPKLNSTFIALCVTVQSVAISGCNHIPQCLFTHTHYTDIHIDTYTSIRSQTESAVPFLLPHVISVCVWGVVDWGGGG